MERSDGPLPGFGGWSGALTPAGCREFKGRPRDARTIGSVQPNLPFPRSTDGVSTGARGVHQATAPSTQLVGCDGDWPAYRALSVGTDGRVKPSWRRAWSARPMEGSKRVADGVVRSEERRVGKRGSISEGTDS